MLGSKLEQLAIDIRINKLIKIDVIPIISSNRLIMKSLIESGKKLHYLSN